MTITLSHISALEYWRTTYGDLRTHKEIIHAKKLMGASQKLSLNHEIINGLRCCNRPLHTLTTKDSLRRSSSNVISHVSSMPLPKGSVFDSGQGFYVVSPDLCFVQIANTVPLPKLIEIGFEFCGTYRVSSENNYKFEPLSSVRQLSSFVSKQHYVHGHRKASQALRYIQDNSASPMETILTMLLCLPYRMGGYGIPKPLLNYRIDLKALNEQATIADYYVCDLFWPHSRVAIEYDSNQFHEGKERIAYDSIRRKDLTARGITVISVTQKEIMDSREVSKLALILAKMIGKNLRYSEPDFLCARNELRKTLLGRRS